MKKKKEKIRGITDTSVYRIASNFCNCGMVFFTNYFIEKKR
jgi:hypothetical protein